MSLNSDKPAAIPRPRLFVSNGPSVAVVSIVIGDDMFLRAHHEFHWSKVRSQFQVELLGKVFQFGGINCVIGYQRHLKIRVTLVQDTDEVLNLEGSKAETLHACSEQLGRTSCLDTD
jgi:hypothetical protein